MVRLRAQIRRVDAQLLEAPPEAVDSPDAPIVGANPTLTAIRNQLQDVEWRAMAGMRDRLIHGYSGVDYDLVWDVVVNKVPSLGTRIRRLLNESE